MNIRVIAQLCYYFLDNILVDKKFLRVVDKETEKTYQVWNMGENFRKSEENQPKLLYGNTVVVWKSQLIDEDYLKEHEEQVRLAMIKELQVEMRFWLVGRVSECFEQLDRETIRKTKDITEPFENDLDKVTDLIEMIMATKGHNNKTVDLSKAIAEFNNSYSYLNETAIRNTIDKLSNVEVLAELSRQAENLHIEDMNDRPTEWLVTGEQVKSALLDWTLFFLTTEQYHEYIELCNSMGV